MSTVRAQTVSYFLSKAGFDRCVYRTSRVRGWGAWTEGFEAKTNHQGDVEVDWNYSSNDRSTDRDLQTTRLTEMEALLSERYTVTRKPVGINNARFVIVVTAKAEEQTPEAPAAEHVKNGVKLGINQKSALHALANNNGGVWHPDAGWVLGSASQTKRILDSLVLRGLVEFEKVYFNTREQYRITEAGRTALAQIIR